MATETAHPSIVLVFTLEANQGVQDAGQELAAATLAAALQMVKNCTSQAWTIEPIADKALFTFVLAPLPGQHIPTVDLWRLTVALRAQPMVFAVTLIF